MNPTSINKSVLYGFKDEKCCGCGACINVCPVGALSYKSNKHYFTIPDIDASKCINCGKCVNACPYTELKFEPTAIEVYAVENKNAEILKNSSSGGVFAELALCVLTGNGVVYGCTMDADFKVFHTKVENKEHLQRIMKSKYVQSHTGFCYREIKKDLLEGKKVLFSGTPCMVAGLKSFLGKKDFGDKLVTVDVVCHGVPSQKMFDAYLEQKNSLLENRITKYTFRDKVKGRDGMKWYTSYETADGKCLRNWPEDSYNYYYMMGFTHRDSCYDCPFASPHRYSDITLCDYWEWAKDNLPFSYKDSVSGVVINTDIGESLFEEIREKFILVESNFESLSSHNSALLRPMRKPAEREAIMGIWESEGYAGMEKNFSNNYKKQIFKGRLVRILPYWFVYYFHNILTKLKIKK